MPLNSIYYLKGGGRFGNQLLNWCHLLAFAFEFQDQNLRLLSIGLIKYNELLSSPEKAYFYLPGHSEKKYPWHIKTVLWLKKKEKHDLAKHFGNVIMYFIYVNPFSKRIKYRNNDYVDFELNTHSFTNDLKHIHSVSLWGWGFRCWELLAKHEEKVRKYMVPDSDHFQSARNFINTISDKNEWLVGVLIRHTDYRNDWFGGKYYFETSQYENWILELHKILISKGRQVKFVICSDEKQDLSALAKQKVSFVWGPGFATGDNHYIQNLYALSMCQLIMSPPSTFSGMAAFMGNVPFILLKNKNQIILEADIMQKHIFEMTKDEDGITSIN